MPQCYRFGSVEVWPEAREVSIAGERAEIGARAFDLLLVLIERRGRVVTKGELLDLVWPGMMVEENNLAAQVSALRKVLGPRALATVPGRGYQLTLVPEGAVSPAENHPEAVDASTSLPIAVDALVGRDDEIAAVRTLLGKHRLVEILGPGGIGKTRLALEVARASVDEFEQGVCWVDLAAVSVPERIAMAVAAAAQVRLSEGDVESQVVRALAKRRMLVVLDNCEHLASEVALLVAAILESSTDLRILVTSQKVVKTQGLGVHRLGALRVPPTGASLDEARKFGAMQLLEQRARALDPRFSITEESVGAAIRLCTQLDGIPLALEMAAVRLPLLGIPLLARQLDKHIELLRNDNERTPDRHRTLRATLEWSHLLLTDSERRVLRHLAAFVGIFRLEAAQGVACGCGLSEAEAIDTLAALVDKSLLQLESFDPPRYRLLETTRTFALEQLSLHGEQDHAWRLHGSAMAGLASEIWERQWALGRRAWIADSMPDYNDLECAFDRAFARGNAEVLAATGETLQSLDFERDVESDALRRKEAALAVLASSNGVARARLRSMLSMFRFAVPAGFDRVENSRQCVADWMTIGDRWRQTYALHGLAWNLAGAGDFAEALRVLEQARALEDDGWPFQRRLALAHARSRIGLFCRDARVVVEACETMERCGWIQDLRVNIDPRGRLGELAYVTGEGDAVALLEQYVDALRRQGQRAVPQALGRLCAAYVKAGELVRARGAAAEALAMPLMWETRETRAVDHIALLAARRGLCEEAALLLGFNDAMYAEGRDVRYWTEEVSAERAMEDVERALGSQAAQRLREEGAKMSRPKAGSIAQRVVEVE